MVQSISWDVYLFVCLFLCLWYRIASLEGFQIIFSFSKCPLESFWLKMLYHHWEMSNSASIAYLLQDTSICLVNVIGQGIPVGKGRWITRDIWKNSLSFSILYTQKKVGTIVKSKRVKFLLLYMWVDYELKWTYSIAKNSSIDTYIHFHFQHSKNKLYIQSWGNFQN